MKNKAESKQEQAAKDQPAKAPKGKRNGAAKASKETNSEPIDRLPSNLEELKGTKSGLVSFLFLSGKDGAEIAKELKAAFKLPDEQAVKIVRRITGRARFFQRAFELVKAK